MEAATRWTAVTSVSIAQIFSAHIFLAVVTKTQESDMRANVLHLIFVKRGHKKEFQSEKLYAKLHRRCDHNVLPLLINNNTIS